MPRWMMATASDVFIHYPLWMMSRNRQTTEFHFILLQDREFGHTEGTNTDFATGRFAGQISRNSQGVFVFPSRSYRAISPLCSRVRAISSSPLRRHSLGKDPISNPYTVPSGPVTVCPGRTTEIPLPGTSCS